MRQPPAPSPRPPLLDVLMALVIGDGTVAEHLEHCMAKLGARSRARAATWITERHAAGAGA